LSISSVGIITIIKQRMSVVQLYMINMTGTLHINLTTMSNQTSAVF